MVTNCDPWGIPMAIQSVALQAPWAKRSVNEPDTALDDQSKGYSWRVVLRNA
jgi:hypothetical protein